MRIMMKIKKNKGFTLTEILLVLVIAATIVISAFLIYPKIEISQKVDLEAKNIATLRNGLSTIYFGAEIPSDITMNTIAVNAKIVPSEMLVGNNKTKIKNTWGGDVYLGSYYINAGAPTLAIQYNHVPVEACVKLVMQTVYSAEQVVVGGGKTGDTGGIVRSGANREVVFGQKREDATQVQELNVANVTAACNMGKDSFILYKFIP